MQQLGLPATNTNMQKPSWRKRVEAVNLIIVIIPIMLMKMARHKHSQRCNYGWPHFKQADVVYLTCRRRQQQTANTKVILQIENYFHGLAGLARIIAIPSLYYYFSFLCRSTAQTSSLGWIQSIAPGLQRDRDIFKHLYSSQQRV